MKNLLIISIFFFGFQNFGNASYKDNIVRQLNKTENISFSFIQTIGGKDERGECIVKYPKKIFCEYETRRNKILVSNGRSLVIKNNKQYYRYPIKKTPFEFLLDKNFLINKINSSKINEVENRYLFFQISENNNNIAFILMGNNAKSKYNLINKNKHIILTSVHPSPLSANRGFFGCNIFEKTNSELKKRDISEINWSLA